MSPAAAAHAVPLGMTFGDGDGVSTPLAVAVFVALALSPVVLGLALRLVDRRRDRRGLRGRRPTAGAPAARAPWAAWPLGVRVAVLACAAAAGWLLAALVS